MAQAWHGPTRTDDTRHLGPLALIAPLLQRLDVAVIIDQHLPPDPQHAFSHGQILSLLFAARLCQPTALINVPAWAADTGADLLWDIPADSLNHDRLGRALDAFFTQRHSILTSVAAQALHLADLPRDRLHFDPTHLCFVGAYETSQPRPLTSPWPPSPTADMPPAHIAHGYGDDAKLLQVGVTCVVDELAAVPLLSQCLDGNANGHTAICQQCDWLLADCLLRPGTLLVSDRGTFSARHVARLHRHGCPVLCSAPWEDYQGLYDSQADQLSWPRASYLSLEQQRRRQTHSSLPQQSRERDRVRLRQGLEAIAVTVTRVHPQTTLASTVSPPVEDAAGVGIERWTSVGRVVHATHLTSEQSRVLPQLRFPPPAQLLARALAPLPLG